MPAVDAAADDARAPGTREPRFSFLGLACRSLLISSTQRPGVEDHADDSQDPDQQQ